MELLIRPSLNDHEVVATLLAPGSVPIMVGTARPVLSRLVVDAPVVVRRPQFADAAASAGIPLLVDPLTPLMQGEVRPEDPWARLDFAQAAAALPSDYQSSRTAVDDFVSAVVEFQLAHGATAITAPYAWATSPDDDWFSVSLDWLVATRRHMDRLGIGVPMFAVLCAQLAKFGGEASWRVGLDRFANAAVAAGVDGIGLCLSPVGDGKDSYPKLLRLFGSAQRLREVSDTPVFAWRQGVYGPALVAAGLDGYETGIGTSEQTNITGNLSARKPTKDGARRGGGGSSRIYLEPLGRSISPRVAQLLFANMSMRAKVMCSDQRCCPGGVAATLDHSREHAVRARARELSTLGALPARSWRLNHVATKASAGLTLATQANRLLAEVGESYRIPSKGLDSLAKLTEELRRADSEGRVA